MPLKSIRKAHRHHCKWTILWEVVLEIPVVESKTMGLSSSLLLKSQEREIRLEAPHQISSQSTTWISLNKIWISSDRMMLWSRKLPLKIVSALTTLLTCSSSSSAEASSKRFNQDQLKKMFKAMYSFTVKKLVVSLTTLSLRRFMWLMLLPILQLKILLCTRRTRSLLLKSRLKKANWEPSSEFSTLNLWEEFHKMISPASSSLNNLPTQYSIDLSPRLRREVREWSTFWWKSSRMLIFLMVARDSCLSRISKR